MGNLGVTRLYKQGVVGSNATVRSTPKHHNKGAQGPYSLGRLCSSR